MNDIGAPPETAPANFGWEAKAIVLAAAAMWGLSFGAILPVLPQIEAALARTPMDQFWSKQLFGIIGLSTVVSAPLTGYLLDRAGPRNILVLGCFLFALAGTAGLYLNSLSSLVLSRFILGAAAAAVDTTSVAIINKRLTGQRRAKWNGARITMVLACALLNPLFGFLGSGFGWRAPFIVYAIGVPIGLLAAAGLSRGREERDAAEASVAIPLLQWFPFRYAALALILGIIIYLPVVYGPFLMREKAGAGPVAISFVLTGMSLVGMLASMLYGYSRKFMAVNPAFILCLFFVAAGALVAGWARDYSGVAAGLLLLSVGQSWVTPNIMTGVGEAVGRDHQGRAVGAVRTMHEIASFACILLVEPIVKRFGPEGAILTAAALAAMLIVIFAAGMVAPRRARKARSL